MKRMMFLLIAMLTLAPMLGVGVSAQTAPAGTGTLRITMISCPPDIDPWWEDEACTQVIEDDGSAMVTLPDNSTAALTSFERDENGAYVITTSPGMVKLTGLGSDNRAHMATDSNDSNSDGGVWYVPADADIDGQVTYYDTEGERMLPLPVPGRESGTINLYLMLCENGVPADGITGCEAIEDDGRIMIPSFDTVNKLIGYERNEDGGYVIEGGEEHPQLMLHAPGIESDNGYETGYEADEMTMNQDAVWNFVEGHERDVYIYYTPPVGTPGAVGNSGLLTHDASLPPAKPAEQGMSMGGPEGVGGANVYVLTCEEGVAPSLETCTEPVSSVDEIMVDMQGRAPVPLSSFEQNEDGSWSVAGPGGLAVLTGMEPIRTDRGITNGEVVDDSTISFSLDSGDEIDVYVIYYFD